MDYLLLCQVSLLLLDTAHPIDKETRKMFEDAIFEEYNKTE